MEVTELILIVDILTIIICNYCIVGFGLLLTTNIEILSRVMVNRVKVQCMQARLMVWRVLCEWGEGVGR